MSENNLNINLDAAAEDKGTGANGMPFAVFCFDIRNMLVWLLLKWKWISAVFFVSLALFWGVMKYVSIHSDNSWTATAKVFHQTRSDRIPSFYKPVETGTVMQFINSGPAVSRAAERMKAQFPNFNRGMFDSVEVSLNRNKKNIISVSASSNSPELAAALANMVAEEGVNEYVNRQNTSVTDLVRERKQQRKKVEEQIDALQGEKKAFFSPDTGLPPDMELAKRREEISVLATHKGDTIMRMQELATRKKSVEEALKRTQPEVVFEKMIDNTTSLGVKGKIAELERLRKRYTDENPKVRVLIDEIEEMRKVAEKPEEQTPARVTYRKNEIYASLEDMLSQINLDLEVASESVKQYDGEIQKKSEALNPVLEKDKEYSGLLRRENMLNDQVSKLSQSISDLEFLTSSAVPDVYVFETAKLPQSSNMRKLRLKAAAMSVSTTMLFLFALAACRLAKMRMTASSEYRTALGVDSIGDLPAASQFPEGVQTSAIQGARRRIRAEAPLGKKFAFLKFDGDAELEKNITELLNISAINGLTSFRLKCLPAGGDVAESEAPDDDEIARGLISVGKFSDTGKFHHNNVHFLDVAEVDLLRFDIEKLTESYDIVTIEAECDADSGFLCAQLSRMSDYSIITAAFERTSKMALHQNIKRIKSDNPAAKIGGMLLNVRKPFYVR